MPAMEGRYNKDSYSLELFIDSTGTIIANLVPPSSSTASTHFIAPPVFVHVASWSIFGHPHDIGVGHAIYTRIVLRSASTRPSLRKALRRPLLCSGLNRYSNLNSFQVELSVSLLNPRYRASFSSSSGILPELVMTYSTAHTALQYEPTVRT